MRGALVISIGAITLLAVGCGDDDTSAAVQQYCASYCGWQGACSAPTSATCETTCATEAARGRPEFFSAAAACYDQRDCSKNDDYCGSVGATAAADPTSDKIKGDCLAKRTSCQGTTPSISDDLCFSIPALNDSARGESAACLTKPCAEVQACLRAAAGW